MELSCHFFWLLRPQIEWTIKCHKKKSLGSIKRALEWAIKVESEKPGDSKTYINDTQQQPHLLKRLPHYTMWQKSSILFRHFKSLPRWGESELNKFRPVCVSNIFETFQQRVLPLQIQFVFKLTAINGSGCNIFWEWHQRYYWRMCVSEKYIKTKNIDESANVFFKYVFDF